MKIFRQNVCLLRESDYICSVKMQLQSAVGKNQE